MTHRRATFPGTSSHSDVHPLHPPRRENVRRNLLEKAFLTMFWSSRMDLCFSQKKLTGDGDERLGGGTEMGGQRARIRTV